MTEGVCERFPESDGRIERVVDPLEEIRDDSTRHGKVIAKKSLGPLEQLKGVSDLLPVVYELALVDTAESGEAQKALRIVRKESLRSGEQDDCGVQQPTIEYQPEPLQEIDGISGSGVVQAMPPDRLIDRANDLAGIQVCHRETRGWQKLPSPLRVHSLEKRPLVHVLGHCPGGRPLSDVGSPVVRVRPVTERHNRHDEDFASVAQGNPFDLKNRAGFDLPKLGNELLQRVRGDFLPANLSLVAHTEHDITPATI